MMIDDTLDIVRELSQRVLIYIQVSESEYKIRDRFERYPKQISPKEAIENVLKDEDLNDFTAELLIKELGRAGVSL